MENLNKLIRVPIIRFECDGNGTGFVWQSLQVPRATRPHKAANAEKSRKK